MSTMRRSNGPISPSGHRRSSFASSTSSSFGGRPSFFQRSASPTRVNLVGSRPPSVRFSFDTTPSRSLSRSSSPAGKQSPRRTCMCSPTTHPGSFRCALHKNSNFQSANGNGNGNSHRLHARRSAMTNSLVRIGTVEGDLVRRALAALIRPSSHQQRRRSAFQLRPSRLSVMSCAGDETA